jgi:hypothetical protein
MVYYDTDNRLQFAREHADRLADDMRRSQRLMSDEGADPGGITLRSLLAASVDRLRRRRGYHAPAYHA